ncbi:MAG: hypothetical protein KC549_05715 [Myxococcales bacterium]|nr:hypothetical protein [Myxococcales bacterium]MCB9545359.1 hypothetical protein [Myxococcales bacterium]
MEHSLVPATLAEDDVPGVIELLEACLAAAGLDPDPGALDVELSPEELDAELWCGRD